MLVGSNGLDKTGKSEFWLSAPGPIGCVNLDIGLEGVVEKWVKRNKKVWVLDFNIPPVTPKGTPMTQAEYIQYFSKTRVAYETLISHRDVRTVVVDTGSEWWDLAKLAEFGTITPKVDVRNRFQPLNQLFRSLIRRAYDSDKNLIITHKMKPNYMTTTKPDGSTTDSWDGKSYKKSGFSDDAYLIQVNIEHLYEGGQFGIRILNCRQNMTIAGYEMTQSECNFSTLGTLVFPDTVERDWQ